MFENPRRGRQARNFTTNVPKILVLKSSSEQIFSRKLPLGAPEVSTEFDGRRISVIVHSSASDKLAVASFTCLACSGLSLIPVKERERVSGKVQRQVSNQRFVNSCLVNSLSVKIFTVIRTL